MTSPLEETGYPLVFTVDRTFDAPSPRLDQAQCTRIRALEGMQKEALVTSSVTGATWRLPCDEGPYLDGEDVAPPPLGFMTTGIVSSYLSAVRTLADRRGIDLNDVELVQDNYYTMNGSALRGDMTGGALPVELEARIDADASAGALEDLVETAVELAPAHGLVTGDLGGSFSLVCNGEQLQPGGVAALDGDPLPDPADDFADLPGQPAQERETPIIYRTGRTSEPPADAGEKYTSEEGSSLESEQDRILHLRGRATVREDGLTHVEQQTFSPRATVFEFLADEPRAYGGSGRAPDPTSYMAAGIGLCFMTQLGRYADIVDADLAGYRIVQDTHFSAGGNEVGPAAGSAHPPETHVYLDTDDGPTFAREALEMSEQTCYLHALCGTPLETTVAVTTA